MAATVKQAMAAVYSTAYGNTTRSAVAKQNGTLSHPSTPRATAAPIVSSSDPPNNA